jgi:hypothetical protein
MNDTEKLVGAYIAAWNEREPARRLALVTETFAPGADYVDPLMAGDGHEGIDAMIGAAQDQFPGHRFRLEGAPDAHHDRLRFSWTLTPEDGGPPVAAGLDFVTLAEDGRMQSVTGFLVAA